MSVHEDLTKYETYLEGFTPPRVQEEWLKYYGQSFLLEHIGEARLWELCHKKRSRVRLKFLASWLVQARREDKKIEAMLAYAHAMKQKREDSQTMRHNSEFL